VATKGGLIEKPLDIGTRVPKDVSTSARVEVKNPGSGKAFISP
jgi:hypothetical protein